MNQSDAILAEIARLVAEGIMYQQRIAELERKLNAAEENKAEKPKK